MDIFAVNPLVMDRSMSRKEVSGVEQKGGESERMRGGRERMLTCIIFRGYGGTRETQPYLS